jgi:lipase
MPAYQLLNVNGVKIAVYEWGQPHTRQPSILFAHATGFHAHIWEQVIALLPDYHCYALDLRGHGHSGKPAQPPEWHFFAEDVVAVGEALGLSGAVGVGHSIGGHTVTWAVAHQPSLFASLLLIDPVILPRELYVGVVDLNHFSARRRNEWKSPDEMVERFKDRVPFNTWKPEVLRDYVEYGLLPNPSGEGFVLACSPEFEAASYNYASAANIYPEIETIQIPVTILRARRSSDNFVINMTDSPTALDLAAQFPNAVDVPLPQYSHFIPMEAPEVVAEYVRKVAGEVSSK